MSKTLKMNQNQTSAAASVSQLVELDELAPATPSGPALLEGKMRLLDSVPVNLSVVLGEAQTTIGELMALRESSLLKIDRLADQPLDIVLNGNVVARGQLVVVDDNFGVRITEVAQAAQP